MSGVDQRKRSTRTLVLTLEEKKVICFVLLAFLLGLAAQQYRAKHPPLPPTKVTAKAQRHPAVAKAIQKNEPKRR